MLEKKWKFRIQISDLQPICHRSSPVSNRPDHLYRFSNHSAKDQPRPPNLGPMAATCGAKPWGFIGRSAAFTPRPLFRRARSDGRKEDFGSSRLPLPLGCLKSGVTDDAYYSRIMPVAPDRSRSLLVRLSPLSSSINSSVSAGLLMCFIPREASA
jgi:hypothetical protein